MQKLLAQCEPIVDKVKTTIIKSYSELITLPTFEERLRYLQTDSQVGIETFGFDRYINQVLYNSKEWKLFKRDMVIRDHGCDLAVIGYYIEFEPIILHHINPLSIEDITEKRDCVFDPENVICTRHKTHNRIHYSENERMIKEFVERKPNDMCPWR